jgi:outer membrane protein assembly factor BamB
VNRESTSPVHGSVAGRRPARHVLSAIALLAAAAAPAAHAQDSFRGWESMRDPDFKFDPDRKVFRNFQPRANANVRELLDHYAKFLSEHAIVPAVRALQQVLDDFGGYVVQVAGSNEDERDDSGTRRRRGNAIADERYAGAAEWARYELMNAPAEVRAAYEKLAERNGRAAFERAAADRDEAALRAVARRYATALVGQQALLAMARLARERGAREIAAMTARRALDFLSAPALEGDGRDAATRAALTAEARAIAALSEGRVDARPAGGRVDVAGQERPLDEFLVAANLSPRHVRDDSWPTFGGDAGRARVSEPPRRPLSLKDGYELPAENARFRGLQSPLASQPHSMPIQPIRLGDRLYVNNTLSVRCYDLLARTLVWEHEGAQLLDPSEFVPVSEYFPPDQNEEPTFSKALVAGLSAADGIVLANLLIPQPQTERNRYNRFRINDPCPWRGLVALDADSGRVVWEQRPFTPRGREPERQDGSPLMRRLDVAAPPAIVDDVVFALGNYIEGGVNSYLAALELKTGRLIYAVPLAIGQQELSMFNMPFQEFTASMPSVLGGTIFCSTNLGLFAAVDAVFGDLRWLAAYDALKIDQPENYFRNKPRAVWWNNRGPLCVDGLVLVTPNDSQKVFAFEPSTGKLRWDFSLKTRRMWPSSWLVGATGGRAFVANTGTIAAVRIEDGRVDATYPAPGQQSLDVVGSGIVTRSEVWLPTSTDLVVLDATASNRLVELRREPWGDQGGGNLLAFQDMVLVSGHDSVVVNFDPAEALATLQAERARRGDSLDLLVRIGSLERQAGDFAHAAQTLARALEMAAGASPDAVARTRAIRCDVLRDEAHAQLAAHRTKEAEAALIEAEKIADDGDTRAQIVRTLLAECATDPKDPRAIGWLTRLRDDFPTARIVVPELSPRPVALGIWVAFELAKHREAAGQHAEALAELQRIQCDFPSEPLLEGDSASAAQAAVDALLERAGPELRGAYDADAERTFAAAAAAGDPARLGLLLRRFPSSKSAPVYAAKELELLREKKQPGEAIAVGAELLRGRAGGGVARAALAELARAARDLGNLALARTLVTRLARGGGDLSIPDDLAAVVRASPAPPATGGETLERLGVREVGDNTYLFGVGDRFDRAVRGEPLPDDVGGVLMREPGPQYSISFVKVPSLETAWTISLASPRRAESQLTLVHCAGTILLRRGADLEAFDLKSGVPLWSKTFDRMVQDVSAGGGVVLVTLSTAPKEGVDPPPAAISAFEPRTGVELFTAALAGIDTRVGQLLPQGDLCVVSSYLRQSQTAEVFDVVSGARRLEPRPFVSGATVPLLLPDAGVLALPASGSTPSSRLGGVARLVGWKLDDGGKAFEFEMAPLQYKLRWILPVAEGLAIYGGTPPNAGVVLVDPRDGARTGDPTPLPQEISESARLCRMIGEESRVRVLGFSEFRKSDSFFSLSLLAGNGKPMWRQEYALPKNTVLCYPPERMYRKGTTLLFATSMQYGGNCSTDLFLVDEESGRLLDRESFEGGVPGERDDVVRCGDWAVLRQKTHLQVLAWR